jgi:hypothetical protein
LSIADCALLRQRYPEDADLQRLLRRHIRAEDLLRRALWEFGSELRVDIERHLGERPLL